MLGKRLLKRRRRRLRTALSPTPAPRVGDSGALKYPRSLHRQRASWISPQRSTACRWRPAPTSSGLSKRFWFGLRYLEVCYFRARALPPPLSARTNTDLCDRCERNVLPAGRRMGPRIFSDGAPPRDAHEAVRQQGDFVPTGRLIIHYKQRQPSDYAPSMLTGPRQSHICA
jgi:hypothetical protein